MEGNAGEGWRGMQERDGGDAGRGMEGMQEEGWRGCRRGMEGMQERDGGDAGEGAPSSVSPSPPASRTFIFYFLFNLSFKKQSEKSNSPVKLQPKSNLKVKRRTIIFQ